MSAIPAMSSNEEAVSALLAVAPPGSGDHALIVGRHAMAAQLILIRGGCIAVATLNPDYVAPDREPTDLAWIMDLERPSDLGPSVAAVIRRLKQGGRLALDVTLLAGRIGLKRVCRQLATLGLHIAATRSAGRRILVLAAPAALPTLRAA